METTSSNPTNSGATLVSGSVPSLLFCLDEFGFWKLSNQVMMTSSDLCPQKIVPDTMAPQYFNGPKHIPYSCCCGLKNFFHLNIKFNVCVSANPKTV